MQNSQLKAIKIYKAIKKARSDLFENTKKLGLFSIFEKSIKTAFKENRPDQRVIELLQIMLNDKDLNSKDPSMDRVFIETTDRLIKIMEISNTNNHKTRMPIYLSNITGQLSRDPVEKFNFFIKPSNKNFKILETLNSEYKQTEEIKRSIKALNNPATRKMINTLNAKIKTKLKLNPTLIESKTGDGYRINNEYELIID
jgi:hypothetical protein